jgi:chromosomal replication initiation ATPase DnaA
MNPYTAVARIITIRQVEEAACEAWEIPIEELYVKRRFREKVEPRQVVFHYRKKYMGHSPRRINDETGFHYANVYHAESVVDNLMETDPIFRKKYDYFLKILSEEVN